MGRRILFGENLSVGVALLLAVAVLGWAVRDGWTARGDAAGLIAMSGGPARVWQGMTAIGDSGTRLAATGVAAVALALARRWPDLVRLVATVLGGMALNSGAKLIVARPRPALLPHLDQVDTFSFPSGHAANMMVLALSLAVLAPARWRAAALVAAVAVAVPIGLSRVALAVHWPSDVVAGWMAGAGWVLVSGAIAARLTRDDRRRSMADG